MGELTCVLVRVDVSRWLTSQKKLRIRRVCVVGSIYGIVYSCVWGYYLERVRCGRGVLIIYFIWRPSSNHAEVFPLLSLPQVM